MRVATCTHLHFPEFGIASFPQLRYGQQKYKPRRGLVFVTRSPSLQFEALALCSMRHDQYCGHRYRVHMRDPTLTHDIIAIGIVHPRPMDIDSWRARLRRLLLVIEQALAA
jgi:hypothetical protein